MHLYQGHSISKGDAVTDFLNIWKNWKCSWSPLDVSASKQETTASLLARQVGLGVPE